MDSDEAGYGYVPNKAGGLWGCWWSFVPLRTGKGDRVFLQFEFSGKGNGLAIRVKVPEESRQSRVRNRVSEVVRELAPLHGIEAVKPSFGKGEHMTVAWVNPSPLARGLEWKRLRETVGRAEALVQGVSECVAADS